MKIISLHDERGTMSGSLTANGNLGLYGLKFPCFEKVTSSAQDAAPSR